MPGLSDCGDGKRWKGALEKPGVGGGEASAAARSSGRVSFIHSLQTRPRPRALPGHLQSRLCPHLTPPIGPATLCFIPWHAVHPPPPPPPDLRSDSHPMSAPAAQANPLAQLASGACGCARDRPKRRTGDGGANVRCKRRVRRVHGAVRAVTRKPTDLNARPPSLSTDPLS